jgi:AbrB family looped-hinge helix DNA binding protein
MSTPAVNAVLRVGEKCEIALPASIQEELHLSEGDLLSASVTEEGQLVLTPVAEDPWDRLRRLARPYFQGIDPIAYQRESRADDDDDAPS